MRWQPQLLSKMPPRRKWQRTTARPALIPLTLPSETSEDLISFFTWDCLGKAGLILENREWRTSGNWRPVSYERKHHIFSIPGSKTSISLPLSACFPWDPHTSLSFLVVSPAPSHPGGKIWYSLSPRSPGQEVRQLWGMGKGPRLLQKEWAFLIRATHARKSVFAQYPFLE